MGSFAVPDLLAFVDPLYHHHHHMSRDCLSEGLLCGISMDLPWNIPQRVHRIQQLSSSFSAMAGSCP